MEWLVVLGTIVFQVVLVCLIYRDINSYVSIFKGFLSINLNKDENKIIPNGSWGKDVKEIVKTLNQYLAKNGNSVVDYHLMKDIVDRHCDRLENNVTTRLPFPLYIGLIGTMLGIVMGLWNLSSSLSETQINVTAFSPLLDSVKSAMIASACGVVATTVLTCLYKSKKEKLESDKDNFLSGIQVELLPNVGSDFTSAMTKMAATLTSFNETFEKNVGNLDYALSTVNDSYENQVSLLEKIEQIKITKIASANIDVYDKLQNCTDEIGGLAGQLEQLKAASASNIESAEKLAGLMPEWQGQIHTLMATFVSNLDQISDAMKTQLSSTTAELQRCFIEQVQAIEDTTKSMPTLVKELDNLSATKKTMMDILSATKEQNTRIDKMLQALATGRPVETTNPLTDWWNKQNKIVKVGVLGVALSIPLLFIVQFIALFK